MVDIRIGQLGCQSPEEAEARARAGVVSRRGARSGRAPRRNAQAWDTGSESMGDPRKREEDTPCPLERPEAGVATEAVSRAGTTRFLPIVRRRS